jgi:tetratricopeptide (TPR) repeat protein
MGFFDKLSGSNPTRASGYAQRAKTALDQGNYAQAFADFTEAIRLDGNDAQLRWRRGVVYSALGDYYRATGDFTEAIRLCPGSAAPYLGRADAYAKQGAFDRAIADQTEAIRLDPSLAVAFCDRGWFHFQTGEYEKAIADCTRAIHLDPTLALAYINRAATYNETAQSDLALADCGEAMRLNAEDARAYYNRAWARAQKGDYRAALADLTEATRRGANDPGTQLAWTMAASGWPLGKPQRDMGSLLNSAVNLATLSLERPGKVPHVTPMAEGFSPFGVAIGPKGHIVYYVPQPQPLQTAASWKVVPILPSFFIPDGPGTYPPGDYAPPPIEAVQHAMKQVAALGCRSAAVVDRVHFAPPDGSEATSAIRVQLEHSEAEPVTSCVQYQLRAGRLQCGKLWAAKRDRLIFGEANRVAAERNGA